MRVLITGIDGFIGTQLVQVLVQDKHVVFGLSRTHSGRRAGVQYIKGSLLNPTQVKRAVSLAKPQQVFHLAAQSNIPASFQDPTGTMSTNVNGSLNVYEAIRLQAPQAQVLSVGSSAEYGLAAQTSRKVKESFPTIPSSPYAVSKVAQGLCAQVYVRAYGLRLMHLRPFAIIGPGKKGDALTDFCQGIVRIERGETTHLRVGTLTAVRDFMDVRDFVRAIRLTARKGKPGAIYNVCNGQGHSLSDMLKILTSLAKVPIEVVQDQAKRRLADDSRIVGDNTLIKKMGYSADYTFRQTVTDTLEYWRREL